MRKSSNLNVFYGIYSACLVLLLLMQRDFVHARTKKNFAVSMYPDFLKGTKRHSSARREKLFSSVKRFDNIFAAHLNSTVDFLLLGEAHWDKVSIYNKLMLLNYLRFAYSARKVKLLHEVDSRESVKAMRTLKDSINYGLGQDPTQIVGPKQTINKIINNLCVNVFAEARLMLNHNGVLSCFTFTAMTLGYSLDFLPLVKAKTRKKWEQKYSTDLNILDVEKRQLIRLNGFSSHLLIAASDKSMAKGAVKAFKTAARSLHVIILGGRHVDGVKQRIQQQLPNSVIVSMASKLSKTFIDIEQYMQTLSTKCVRAIASCPPGIQLISRAQKPNFCLLGDAYNRSNTQCNSVIHKTLQLADDEIKADVVMALTPPRRSQFTITDLWLPRKTVQYLKSKNDQEHKAKADATASLDL